MAYYSNVDIDVQIIPALWDEFKSEFKKAMGFWGPYYKDTPEAKKYAWVRYLRDHLFLKEENKKVRAYGRFPAYESDAFLDFLTKYAQSGVWYVIGEDAKGTKAHFKDGKKYLLKDLVVDARIYDKVKEFAEEQTNLLEKQK